MSLQLCVFVALVHHFNDLHGAIWLQLTSCSLIKSQVSMGGDQCQKYLFLVDVQTYFVGTFFMVIFLFERHFQI